MPGQDDPNNFRVQGLAHVCHCDHFSTLLFQVVNRELEKTLVIEDDVRFEHQFKRKLMKLMDDIEQAQLDWELM